MTHLNRNQIQQFENQRGCQFFHGSIINSRNLQRMDQVTMGYQKKTVDHQTVNCQKNYLQRVEVQKADLQEVNLQEVNLQEINHQKVVHLKVHLTVLHLTAQLLIVPVECLYLE